MSQTENNNIPAANGGQSPEQAEKTAQSAQNGLPLRAALGAVGGALGGEALALGGFTGKIFGEMSAEANKRGFSILEVAGKDPKMGEELANAMLANPQALKRLKPFMLAVLAAPFVGSAVGAWAAAADGNRKLKRKQAALEELRADTTNADWRAHIEIAKAERETGNADAKSMGK